MSGFHGDLTFSAKTDQERGNFAIELAAFTGKFVAMPKAFNRSVVAIHRSQGYLTGSGAKEMRVVTKMISQARKNS
jgi:hypothetical protein